MIVAVGSTRKPKVDAVREAFERIRRDTSWPQQEPEFLARDVSPWAPAMPLSAEELMGGARERVRQLGKLVDEEGLEADILVGMEGGFNIIHSPAGKRQIFLESWVYVSDRQDGYFARGGGILVPEQLGAAVIDEGIELGEAVDRCSGISDVRSKQGAWGYLTRDMVSRRDSFVLALIAALAPFYNSRAFV